MSDLSQVRTVPAGATSFLLREHAQGTPGQGTTPVLLLHGVPETSSCWRDVAPALARGRRVLAPDLPGLGFVGFNSSFVSTLSAELGAHWLARYLDGALKRQPTNAAMRAGIARALDWRRRGRGVASTYGGLCVAPFHHAHFDELMADMGAQTKLSNVLAAHLAPISPAAYAGLLATAPGRVPARKGAS